jgi:hypothetical protein
VRGTTSQEQAERPGFLGGAARPCPFPKANNGQTTIEIGVTCQKRSGGTRNCREAVVLLHPGALAVLGDDVPCFRVRAYVDTGDRERAGLRVHARSTLSMLPSSTAMTFTFAPAAVSTPATRQIVSSTRIAP